MKFYEVRKDDNIPLQKTKSLLLTTGQTTVLSYPSLMVPPMAIFLSAKQHNHLTSACATSMSVLH